MCNIAHVVSGKIYAGLESQAENTVLGLKEFSKHNLQVILFHDNILAQRLRERNIKVQVISVGISNYFISLKHIKKILIASNIDIVHSHGYKANITAYHASKNIPGIKRIRSEHGLHEPFKGFKLLKYKLYDYLDKQIARKYTHKVIGVSKDVQKYLLGFLPATKVICLQNSVGPPETVPDEKVRRLRKELNISPGMRVVGIIGRLVPVKNHRLFVDIICELSKLDNNIIGMIVGIGPLENALKVYAEERGISEKVIFTGFRKDISSIMLALDVVVFTSLHEGLPMVLLEAMKMRTPVVAVKAGGLTEVLSGRCQGSLSDSYDAGELARKCLNVLNDSALRNSMLDAAGEKVRECYSLESYTDRLSRIYSELLNLP